jgi:geranylgeranyl pyrophosphate synthase
VIPLEVGEALTPAAVLEDVERRIDRFFDESGARSAERFSRYGDLGRAARAAAMGGKRLRPRLVVAPYLLLGGSRREPAIEVAAAVELLHTALLLHDDVIDGDVERRGAPNLVGTFTRAATDQGVPAAVARGWGESAAILAGDLLLTAAMRLTAGLEIAPAARERIIRLLDESVFRAAAGELADVAYASGLENPSAAAIREMMADKTAHYSLELPLRAAAILADAGEAVEDLLGAVGRSLGLVFQMRDDLLGVFGRPEETGKSVVGDLREGKRTLLIAFAEGTPAWASVEAAFGSPALDDDGAQALRAALEECGARARLEAEIDRERSVVHALLDDPALPRALVELLAHETAAAAERRS